MLARILAPFSCETFNADFFECQPLHVVRSEPEWYSELVQPAHVDEILQLTASRQSDDFRIVRSRGRSVESFNVQTDERGVPTIGSLSAAYQDGYTIVVNGIDRRWGSISRFAAALSDDIGHPIGVNLYLTPKNSQGFQPHVDGHDVFVLQITGTKIWEIYSSPKIELPLEDQHVEIDAAQVGLALIQPVLTPGDVLYIPRGYAHKGMTSSESSMHLTVGIHSRRWTSVLHRAIDIMAANDVEARRSIPRDWEVEKLQHHLQRLLAAAATEAVAAAALEEHEQAQVRESVSAPGGLFVALDQADNISLDSMLSRRAGLRYRLEDNESEAILHFGKSQLSGPLSIAPALRFLAENAQFHVRDLPDSYTDDSKIVLSRRWIREGMVVGPNQENNNGKEEIPR